MKNIAFYMIMNSLYTMSYKRYKTHIQKMIKPTCFKDGVKQKLIKVKSLNYEEKKYCRIYFDFDNFNSKNRMMLLNINLKNKTLSNVDILLKELQSNFIKSKNSLDIKFIRRSDFMSVYAKKFNKYLDSSILSKLLKHNDFGILLCCKSHILYLHIREIISQDPIYNDSQIKKALMERYKIDSNVRAICKVRAKYLIPPYFKRATISYIANEIFFSKVYTLSKNEIYKSAPVSSGIYELISNKLTIYIGSSKNLKARLYSYAINNAHTQSLRNYINENLIEFRYIKTSFYKNYERIFLEDFNKLFCALPLLNKQRVLK